MKMVSVDDEVHEQIKVWSEMTGLPMKTVVKIALGSFVPPTAVEPVPPTVVEPVALSAREEAHQRGQSKYRGSPCKHGHDGERFSSTGQCVMCMEVRNRAHTVPGEPYEAIVHRVGLSKQRETLYVSNVPCVLCHGFNRRVKSGKCSDCFAGNGQRIQDVDLGPLPIATGEEMALRLKRASWSK